MMINILALGGAKPDLTGDISVISLLLASWGDFNYKAGDKTDQTSIEDKTGTQRAKLYKVKIRGRWGWLPATGLLLFSGIERGEKL